MPCLSNPHLYFVFDLNTGRWSLSPQTQEAPHLENVRLGAAYRVRSKPVLWNGAWDETRADAPVWVNSTHGRLTVLKVRGRTRSYQKEPGALRLDLEFALPEARPFLLWRATMHNASGQPLTLETIDLAVVGPQPARRRLAAWPLQLFFGMGGAEGSSGALRLHPSPGRLAFFSSSDQSRGFADMLPAGTRQPSSYFGSPGNPKRVNLHTPNVPGRRHFVSDMFGVMGDQDHKTAVIAGFVSRREQSGRVEAQLDAFAPSLRLTTQCAGVTLPPGGQRATEWAYLQFVTLDRPDPLAEYVEAVTRGSPVV